MTAVTKDYFAGPVAERYDDHLGEWGDPEVVGRAVDFLADLAGGGAALELGIGTGRIALPLAARGVPVHGIDLSPDMVAQLRAKPGGDAIPVTIGDFATTSLDGTFTLAYVVFNTIINLTTQVPRLHASRTSPTISCRAAASSSSWASGAARRCRSSI